MPSTVHKVAPLGHRLLSSTCIYLGWCCTAVNACAVNLMPQPTYIVPKNKVLLVFMHSAAAGAAVLSICSTVFLAGIASLQSTCQESGTFPGLNGVTSSPTGVFGEYLLLLTAIHQRAATAASPEHW